MKNRSEIVYDKRIWVNSGLLLLYLLCVCYLLQPQNIFIDVILFSFRFRYSRCRSVQRPVWYPNSKLEMLLYDTSNQRRRRPFRFSRRWMWLNDRSRRRRYLFKHNFFIKKSNTNVLQVTRHRLLSVLSLPYSNSLINTMLRANTYKCLGI